MFSRVMISDKVLRNMTFALTYNNASIPTRKEFWRIVRCSGAYTKSGVYRDLLFVDPFSGVTYELNGIKRGIRIDVFSVRVGWHSGMLSFVN